MTRRRPRLARPEALSFVIERAGENRFTKDRAPIPMHQWAQIVGARVADRARPMALDRETLTVRAATSVWASELSMLAPDILARLRERGFQVKELRFTVGAIEASARPLEVRPSRKLPPPVPVPTELVSVLASVEDDELREAIEHAACANLAWQQHVTRIAGTLERDTAAPRPISAAPPAARAPQAAETGTAPPDRTTEASREGARGNPASARDRRR